MTTIETTEVAETTPCPSWCIQPNCRGEHCAQPAKPVIATRSQPVTDDYGRKVLPSLSVAMDWSEGWGAGIAVSLHDQSSDTEYRFELHETMQLITDLLDAYVTATRGIKYLPGGAAGLRKLTTALQYMEVGR